jgi:hypothetical protein
LSGFFIWIKNSFFISGKATYTYNLMTKKILSGTSAKIFASVLIILITINSCKKGGGFGYADIDPPAPLDTTTTAPAIFSISPTQGLPNSTVIIKGKYLKAGVSNNVVYLNDLQATVTSASSTEIAITVPASAKSGVFAIRTGAAQLATSKFNVMEGTVSTAFNLSPVHIEHIALDRDGNTFGDNPTVIYKITSAGLRSEFAGSATNFKSIGDITVRQSGDMYVANTGNFNIMKVTPIKAASVFAGDGTPGYTDGIGTAAQFTAPTRITHDVVGNLYVVDVHRIRKISTSGVVTTLAGNGVDGSVDGPGTTAQFGTLSGIAVDADNNVFVSDSKYLKIRKITPAGVVTTLAGSGTAGFANGEGNSAQFTKPTGLAVDESGNLFVSDENSSLPMYTVRMVNKGGFVSTLIKGQSNTGVDNGLTYSASVNSPNGLTFDTSGNLFIVNTGANIISKVTFNVKP